LGALRTIVAAALVRRIPNLAVPRSAGRASSWPLPVLFAPRRWHRCRHPTAAGTQRHW
jgi:hypothetical protein